MPSQWLAIGAETDPLRRARELQRSWERLLSDGALVGELPPGATKGLRPAIVESWRRSLATGLDPTDSLAPIEADESEVRERWFAHPLGSLTHVLAEQLGKLAEESRSVVVVTDGAGLVLHRIGEEWLKQRAAEMNLVEGAHYSEAADGTNGIGTALAADHAFQVFAFEHFNQRHHQWICSGAPVHDPVTGQTIGVIDLSSLWKIAHPRSLALVTAAVRTIEQRLLDLRRDQDARLRRHYGDLVTRSTDLLVNRDGYVLDGAEVERSKPLDVPEGGGEVVLGDGSIAVAASLGQGEAYLLRRVAARHARSAPIEVLERAETHLRELVTEQSALRHVATLVARESAPDQLFAAVAEQVARVFAIPLVRLVRFEPEGSVVVGGFSEGDDEFFPIGSRWPLFSTGAIATVRRTGRPARAENYTHLSGEFTAVFHAAGVRSAVASPIVVEGRLWGAMVVHSRRDEPFPESTEARLTDFTALVATAIANAESRVAIARLADEQAALRRVATLVAEAARPAEIFSGVSNEVATLFRTELVVVGKFDGDPVALLIVGVGDGADEPVVGSRWKLDDALASTAVYRTGVPARFDHDSTIADPDVAAVVERFSPTATVAVPIKVEGRLWGSIIVATRGTVLPTDTEERLQRFTNLIATALAGAEARAELERLAEEQAALRRVATLVAQDTAPAEIFAAVSAEVDRVFRLDPATFDIAVVGRFDHGPELVVVGLSKSAEAVPIGSRWPPDELFAPTHVLRTGRSARIRADDVTSAGGEVADFLRQHGYLSQVASPIVVDGRLWGAMSVNTRNDVPPDTEERLERFTDLVATAIANAKSRETLARLADEQSALRRVATRVAQGALPAEVFAAVSAEVDRLLRLAPDRADIAGVVRFDPGPEHVVVGVSRALEAVRLGSRWPPIDLYAPTRVLHTGRSARVGEDDLAVGGPEAEFLRESGYLSQVASPIVVNGRLWGAISVNAAETLPPDTEERLEKFIELIATAIANTESREALGALADEQTALRRVATLVAEEVAPARTFGAVCEQVGHLLEADITALETFPGNGTATVIAFWSREGSSVPVGAPRPVKPNTIAARILSTHASARRDIHNDAHVDVGPFADDLQLESTVGAPILVGGRLWGALMAGTRRSDPWVEEAETRLSAFSELVATAIANAESRDALARLADEQAALRRVATLVARDAPPREVFDAVAMEVGSLLDADVTVVGRYDADGAATAIGSWSASPGGVPVGTRSAVGGHNVLTLVSETESPARVDGYDDGSGEAAEIARRHGWRSSIAAPISVEGRLWGVMLVATKRSDPFPAGAEERLSAFTDLVATAIANAESKSELAASRRRIVAAADDARRRIERDLHDGIQQRLIALSFRARAMTRRPPDELPGIAAELSEGLRDASDELREISRGIHPTILTEAGLGPALRALARRSDVPVDVDVRLDERLPTAVEAAAYYIASEALTNVAKHADANVVRLIAAHDEGVLTLEVRDDGVGGVDAGRGSGILGLTDRVEALGGTISIASPRRGGTALSVRLPTAP